MMEKYGIIHYLQSKDMGIILNVNSKNEESNALLGLNSVDSILKPDDFRLIKFKNEQQLHNNNNNSYTLLNYVNTKHNNTIAFTFNLKTLPAIVPSSSRH